MDDSVFQIIKPDEYEPDLFNSDMSVQEEITVGSSDNMLSSYHSNLSNTNSNNNMDFSSSNSNIINIKNNNNKVNLINTTNIINNNQSMDLIKPIKPQLIYFKSNSNNMNNNIRTIKVANNSKPMKVFPISRLNQDNNNNSNNRLIRINSGSNNNITNIGSNNVTRVLNPNMIRNVQITKLSNFNVTKLGGNQKIVFANRSSMPGKFTTTNNNNNSNTMVTPISYIQASSLSQFTNQHPHLHHNININNNTIIQPIHHHQQQQQSSSSSNNQAALKLEPGDSGFYNLTGGTGPTRYYPRTNSPDKDSMDGSQEQMANVYKTNGLRKYARSVCDKVKEKGTTTYSEVADELVHEYAAEHPMIPPDQLHYIQKNIRRRVYDALNVLMALKVLDKEKKEIKWKGLPVNLLEECKQLEEEKAVKTELLQQRVEELSELALQLVSYKNLVGRNRQKEKELLQQGVAATAVNNNNERIKLPFIVISTNNNTVIDCNISPQKLDYLFTFDQPFEMQDEFQTLKQSGFTLRLGTSQCTESQYKRCLELVPNTLRFYVEAIYQQRPAIVPDFVSLHRRNMAAAAARQQNNNNTNSNNTSSSKMISAGGGTAYRSSTMTPYWSSESPSIIGGGGDTVGGGVQSSSSLKRYNSASSTSWGDSSTKLSMMNHPSHNFSQQQQIVNTAGGYSHSLHHNLHHNHQGGDIEDEDDIEVMDEEADFPSD